MKRILKKIWNWFDDRSGITENIMPIIKHPVPPGAKWAYVFGSATLFCFVLQVVTGIALAFLYQPSSQGAYESLDFITNKAKFGNALRGIHYYGASGMIIFVGIHMMRVYITASYKFPREMSWISGVFLLFLTIAMGFTGQLLRWDSNGVWSAVVAAQQLGRIPVIGTFAARFLLGGDTIGGQSLSRFFALHVFIFPAFIFMFVGYHLYLVIRNGISEPAKKGSLVDPRTYRAWYKNMLKEKGVPFWPDAAWRDAFFSAIVVVAVVLLATFIGPPALTSPPNPSHINTAPSPDWYMLPIFALFALMPPKIESYVIVIGPVLTVIFLLVLPFISNKGERSPIRRPWAIFGCICVIVFILSLLTIGLQAPWSPDFKTEALTIKNIKDKNPDAQIQNGVNLFYLKGCQYCHKINGYGGLKGPDLTLVGRRLSTAQMEVRIVNGAADMPAYGGILKKEEMNDIVAFLASQK